MLQLIDVYDRYQDVVLAVDRVAKKDVGSYGIIDVASTNGKTHEVRDFVEKPNPKNAPSNLAWIGKCIITNEIFEILSKMKYGKSGEIRLADAFGILLKKHSIYACELEGKRFDCGSKLGFLKATVHFGLNHKDLKTDFAKYLRSIKM